MQGLLSKWSLSLCRCLRTSQYGGRTSTRSSHGPKAHGGHSVTPPSHHTQLLDSGHDLHGPEPPLPRLAQNAQAIGLLPEQSVACDGFTCQDIRGGGPEYTPLHDVRVARLAAATRTLASAKRDRPMVIGWSAAPSNVLGPRPARNVRSTPSLLLYFLQGVLPRRCSGTSWVSSTVGRNMPDLGGGAADGQSERVLATELGVDQEQVATCVDGVQERNLLLTGCALQPEASSMHRL
ncbi:hypothetical protein HaLaN_09423 [Haematococcus lacustris]|uniref:Uncharacterized protein n=1 Tax=Haematococcus lacustris TaxID=44745 RepID=A0A699YTP3_HAELA|nr:hypothetical protein HaLaN_09423 [Haematococcus lacustris]